MPCTWNKIEHSIRKYGTWDKHPDADRVIENMTSAVKKDFPERIDEFNAILKKARQTNQIIHQCNKLGFEGEQSSQIRIVQERMKWAHPGSETQTLQALLDTLTEIDFSFYIKKAKESYKRGVQGRKRKNQAITRAKSGNPKTTLAPRLKQAYRDLLGAVPPKTRRCCEPCAKLHGNDIRTLKPRNKWTLLVDETGTDFISSAQTRSDEDRRLGRMVGLLLPRNHGLPNLKKGWHAVDKGLAEIDRTLQMVLNAECGIFGISVKSIPMSPKERWAQLIRSLLDWIVRLIPFDGKTHIQVLVEQRAMYTSGQNWRLMADMIQYDLGLTFPDRAENIDLNIQVIDKQGHPCNGYVDAIAYTWAQGSHASKIRLQESGLENTCLLSFYPDLLLQNWNAYCRGQQMEPLEWSDLVAEPGADDPVCLATTLLDALGHECAKNARLWETYVQQCISLAHGKAVVLEALARQVAWLDRFKPKGSQIPKPLQLIWLTVRLASANHHGNTEIAEIKELGSLSNDLYLENAPLVCNADLHRAVQHTNRFEFAQASVPLKRWENCDPAVPGLRYRAQVLSSMGQHRAFSGENKKAVQYFDQAIDAFKQLSDGGTSEIEQTGTYRLIAMMDETEYSDETVTEEFISLFGTIDFDRDIVGTDDASRKYTHHLLLRYLVHRGNPAVEKEYLDKQAYWRTGTGHPWPLIQAYRALLLKKQRNNEKALETMLEGAVLAFEPGQGATVRFIGTCLRAISHSWGDDWTEGKKVLEALETGLPAAANRLQIITGFLDEPFDGLELLKKTLPFNFR